MTKISVIVRMLRNERAQKFLRRAHSIKMDDCEEEEMVLRFIILKELYASRSIALIENSLRSFPMAL